MDIFEEHELGRTDGTVAIDTRDLNRTAVIHMARQCRQNIDIISRDLEPPLYDTAEFVDAVKNMILNNHRARIRILLIEPQSVVKRGHRLLNLAMTLSSFFEIRKPGPDYKDVNEALFIADNCGYLHRINSSRFEGKVNFNDKRSVKSFLDQFDEIWEKAVPDANLRRLSI